MLKMTIKDLIRLCNGDLDKMIIIETELDGQRGWSNVEINRQTENTVYIESERHGLFHDN